MQLDNDPRFAVRGKRIYFTFDGTEISCIKGQSIAAAALANNITSFSRDRKDRPRGVFCGMGVCFECMVSVAGEGDTRACLTPAREGINVSSSSYLRDLSSAEAGLSTKSTVEQQPTEISGRTTIDVVVVGAGPAGLAAAIALQEAGVSVVVIDERPVAGGQYYKPLAASHKFTKTPSDQQYADSAELIHALQTGTAEFLSNATVWNAEKKSDKRIALFIQIGMQTRRIDCQRLILATGAYEAPCVFPGWTLPGVMTTGAAQGLLRSYRTVAGKSIVIAGNGPLNLQVAAELVQSGAKVVAVAESSPGLSLRQLKSALKALILNPRLIWRGLEYLRILRKAGVPIYFQHHIVKASGEARVESLELAPLQRAVTGSWTVDKALNKTLSADTLCLGYGFLPNNELARLLGCRFTHNDEIGRESPVRSASGRTSEHEVFLIGDGGQFAGAQAALTEGKLAAWEAIDAAAP